MRKLLILIITLLILFFTISCEKNGTISVWSNTDEFYNMIDSYLKDHPDVQIDFSIIDVYQFENKLDPILASGRGVPDIIVMESSYVRKYIESGFLLDITDIYEANKEKIIPYTVEVGSYNGRVYGLSWQATPGAFFYRRSLAKKYFGTDDPAVIQTHFSDVDTFLKSAELLKSKSNGSCVTIASQIDLFIIMLYMREQPWIVDKKLVIDDVVLKGMDVSKTLYDNRLEGRITSWSEGWFAGLKGELKDNTGKDIEVFGYLVPTWGLSYVLKKNAPNTSGDWAMIEGPVPYRHGGTWIGAYKGTKHIEAVKNIIQYLTTDDDFLEQYALSTGDFVSNLNVIEKIKDNFNEPFLGGQNHYAEFARLARNVNGRLVQGNDRTILNYLSVSLNDYLYNDKDKLDVIADFRNQIETILDLK